MIVSRNLIFIHQPKAGGTFVTSALRLLHERGARKFLFRIARKIRHQDLQIQLGYFVLRFVGLARHPGVEAIPASYRDKKVFSTIRNPYDWYVSHYEYGWFAKHPEEAGIENRLRNRWHGFPNLSFADFVQFTNAELARPCQRNLPDDRKIGWITSELIARLCTRPDEAFRRIEDERELSTYVRSCLASIRLLRVERLNEELVGFLVENGYRREKVEFIRALGRIYPSGGGRAEDRGWEQYYTPELKAFVRLRDRLLFDLFPEYDV